MGRGQHVGEMASLSAQIQEKLVEAGLPSYPSMSRAANAVGKMISHYEGIARRTTESTATN